MEAASPSDEDGKPETLPPSLEDRKLEAEIAKLQIETENLRRNRSSESARFWISVLAPLVGSAAVVATLIFQIVQFNENLEQERAAAEAKEFRESLQAFQSTAPSGAKMAMAESQLRTFLDSPNFSPNVKAQVRSSFISALAGIEDPADFQRLFSKLFPTINHEALPDLVQVSGTQRGLLANMLDERQTAEKAVESAKQEPQRTLAQTRLNYAKSEIESLDFADRIVSDAIAKILRERSAKGNDDISFTELWYADLHDVDFSGVDIRGTWFEQCSLAGADLSQVRSFEGATWYGTQWWLAKSIHPDLLASLRDGQYKFDPGVQYAGPPIDEAGYKAKVAALSQPRNLK